MKTNKFGKMIKYERKFVSLKWTLGRYYLNRNATGKHKLNHGFKYRGKAMY